MTQEFHLSVVATSRNDGHGGDLIGRMQAFVDGFVAQCRRFGLDAELILVEWNPPRDRPRLAEVLTWPAERGAWEIRIITVPEPACAALENSDKIPLFQMIAKNVGIRRARGRFVLATNIDILFSDEVVRFMRDRLRDGPIYRLDRCDVPPDVPRDSDFARVLDFCEREMFRINARGKTLIRRGDKWVNARPAIRFWTRLEFPRFTLRRTRMVRRALVKLARLVRKLTSAHTWSRPVGPRAGRWLKGILTGLARVPIRLARTAHALSSWCRTVYLRIRTRLERLFVRQLHTNACGDFTLCSRDVWFALRGYVEWPIFSWHLDSLLLHQAHCNGHAEIDLPAPYRVFHIEHDIGSGYSPEGERSLFDRLERNGIPYLTWPDFLALDRQMTADAKRQGKIIFNPETWGFATERFEETVVVARESRKAVVS